MPLEWLIDIIKEWVIEQAYATEAWVLEWITPYNVTGDLTPDVTCTYFKGGTYNGKPYYVRQDGTVFIWWNGIATWYISAGTGILFGPRWFRNDPDIEGLYAPLGGASGNATVAEGYKLLCTGFIDRGDPAAGDFAIGDLTLDGAWHDLDLSGIVPAGAKGVLFHISARAIFANIPFVITNADYVNMNSYSEIISQAANITTAGDFSSPLSADRKLQYLAPPVFWAIIDIVVKGWWL